MFLSDLGLPITFYFFTNTSQKMIDNHIIDQKSYTAKTIVSLKAIYE